MRRVLIFANPIAGRGQGRALADTLHRELQSRGYAPHVILSRAESANLSIPPTDIHAAIIIGGDGTLRSVADFAIASAASSTYSAIPYPLLIVPMGTANLMGKHLGIAWNKPTLAADVADALDHGKTVQLDVARTREGIFLLVAGVGFDAAVVHELARIRTGPITMLTYLGPMLRTFFNYDFPPLTVTADDRHVFGPAPALALIGNVREYGTGFPLLPHASPTDQLLDLCIMPCSSRRQLIHLGLSAAAGQHIEEEGVIYIKAKSIHITSPKPVPVEVDGEAAGFTPLHIDLLPGRIPFIVPPNHD